MDRAKAERAGPGWKKGGRKETAFSAHFFLHFLPWISIAIFFSSLDIFLLQLCAATTEKFCVKNDKEIKKESSFALGGYMLSRA
jgi:hypothetical protein